MRRFARALLLRCPNCGQTGIFSRWFRMVDTCPQCHLAFERHEGYWLGAIAINTGISIVVFVAAFTLPIVLTWPDPPWTTISIVLVSLAVIVPIVAYPMSRTLWVALEIGMNPAEPP